MATFIKTPAGTWKVLVRKTGWPTVSKTFRTKRDAEDWARQVEDEMVRGIHIKRPPPGRMTVRIALTRYLAEITPTKAAKTQQSEQGNAKILIMRLGEYALEAVTPGIITKYRDTRLSEYSRRGNLIRPNTVRLELALLSQMFNVAIKEWRIGLSSNPVLHIRRMGVGSGRDRRLLPGEETRLLRAASTLDNPMLDWIIRIALATGMRSSEILSLRRHQVKLKQRVVHIQASKNGSARTVPLTQTIVPVFTRVLNHSAHLPDTDLIFFGTPGKDGKRRPYVFNKLWNGIKKQEKITNLHFHDLRHEAISRLVEAGLSDQEVSAISGHRSMQMLKRYTHLRAESLVSRLDEIQVKLRDTL